MFLEGRLERNTFLRMSSIRICRNRNIFFQINCIYALRICFSFKCIKSIAKVTKWGNKKKVELLVWSKDYNSKTLYDLDLHVICLICPPP